MRSSPSLVATSLVLGLLVTACGSVSSSASIVSPSAASVPVSPTQVATPSLSSATPIPSSASTWTATGSMTEARTGHTATLLHDGRVLVVGGYDGEGPPTGDVAAVRLASAEIYDPTGDGWSATSGMSIARAGHTATLLPDGSVLVVGGAAEDDRLEGGPRSATAEVYDPSTGTWSVTGSMTEARTFFSATMLPNGIVLVAGGSANYSEAELYDPASGRWTATGSMLEGRRGHSATLLLDGTVLAAGGCACSEPPPTASAELYDPSNGTWAATGSMAEGRMAHSAILTADGRILVTTDGLFDDTPASTELYDPSAGRWSAAGDMVLGRVGPAIAPLSDGRVLASGGFDPDRALGGEPTPLTSVEVFDSATGRWTVTTSMGRARHGHSMTLLADGRVLVVGGDDATGARSAEIYDPGTG